MGGTAPLSIWEGKTVAKLVRFCATSHFDHKYLQKGRRYRQAEKLLIDYDPSHVRIKKFGKVWSTNKKLQWCMLTHPRSYYSNNYISAPRGRCRLTFLHALENDQGFLLHTLLGMGVPPTIFNDEHSKIGLKFGVCTPRTLGLWGATSTNFSR